MQFNYNCGHDHSALLERAHKNFLRRRLRAVHGEKDRANKETRNSTRTGRRTYVYLWLTVHSAACCNSRRTATLYLRSGYRISSFAITRGRVRFSPRRDGRINRPAGRLEDCALQTWTRSRRGAKRCRFSIYTARERGQRTGRSRRCSPPKKQSCRDSPGKFYPDDSTKL